MLSIEALLLKGRAHPLLKAFDLESTNSQAHILSFNVKNLTSSVKITHNHCICSIKNHNIHIIIASGQNAIIEFPHTAINNLKFVKLILLSNYGKVNLYCYGYTRENIIFLEGKDTLWSILRLS